MQTHYGYVRVSTQEQNEDRQLLALAPYQRERGSGFVPVLTPHIV